MTLYDKIREKHGKPKPILFTTENVRAIIDGRKSQTRRLNSLKDQPPDDYPFLGFVTASNNDSHVGCGMWGIEDNPRPFCYRKPPYLTGDILYVRETFRPCNVFINGTRQYFYRATISGENKIIFNDKGWKWKPSIFMPKKIARLFLRVTDVRVERLQGISEEDAKAEGIKAFTKDGQLYKYHFKDDFVWQDAPRKAKKAFKELWNSINAKPKPVKIDGEIDHYISFPWENIQEEREHRGKKWIVHGNPWIWIIEFEEVKP